MQTESAPGAQRGNYAGAPTGFRRLPTEEDAKRQHRERQVLVADRTAHSNRIKGILMTLGIRDANPRRHDFPKHLETMRTATGDPGPARPSCAR